MGVINRILNKFNMNLAWVFPRPFERFGVKGRNLVGAEIGVYKGEHAESLLKNLHLRRIYLIDPYTLYADYKDGKNHYGIDQEPLNIARIKAKKRLRKYSNRICWIKKKSEDAMQDLPNNLDFVYIDVAHDYENVKKDIRNYYPKLRDCGVLGGHDIYNGNSPEHEGVIRAVMEFAIKEKLQLYIQDPDWWIIKSKEWSNY